jgi:hypothetical protein
MSPRGRDRGGGPARRWRLAAFAALATVLLHVAALHALRRGLDESWVSGPGRLDPVRVALVPAAVPPPEVTAAAVPVAAPPPAAPPASAPPVPAPAPAGARLLPETTDPDPPSASAEGGERVAAVREAGAAPDSSAAVRDDATAAAGTGPEGQRSAEPRLAEGPPESRPPTEARVPEAAVPLHGVALPAPSPGRRRFRIHYGDYAEGNVVAELDYALEIEQDRYRLRTEARAVGLTALFWSGALSQASTGRLGTDGMEPERYVEQRGRRAERWTSVDRATGVALFSGGERVPLVAGVQDRLSLLLQLGLIARAQPQRMAAGQRIEVPELGSRGIAPAVFLSRGDESLATGGGPLRALHLERRDGNPARDPRVDVWLGYDHGMTPVRIRLTDPAGRVLDQVLVP